MHNQSRSFAHDIYFLKEKLTHQQLSNAINRCLCQAEAFSIIATMIDPEAVRPDVLNNYLWGLSDMIQEARWLYEHLDAE